MMSKLYNIKNSIKKTMGIREGTVRDMYNVEEIYHEGQLMMQEIDKWYNKYIHGTREESYYNHVDNIQQVQKALGVGMYKDVVDALSGLIVGEEFEISVHNDEVDNYVQEVLSKNNMYENIHDHIERMFALGGIVYKMYIENNKIKYQVVLPYDYDIVGNSDGEDAILFYTRVEVGREVYTIYETHITEGKDYTVYTECYKGERGNFKNKVNIQNLRGYEEVEEVVIYEGMDIKLYVHIKPMYSNNIDIDSKKGISVYSGTMDIIESIDYNYNYLQNELRLGKRKLSVNKSVVQQVRGKAVFDYNQDLYLVHNSIDSEPVKEHGGELRVDPILRAMYTSIHLLNSKLGLDEGVLGVDERRIALTATEVISRDSKTYRTKMRHQKGIMKGIRELVYIISVLGVYVGEINGGVERKNINVRFGDGVVEDDSAIIEKNIKLVENRLQSPIRSIMEIHGVGRDEAEEIMKEIGEYNNIQK